MPCSAPDYAGVIRIRAAHSRAPVFRTFIILPLNTLSFSLDMHSCALRWALITTGNCRAVE